MPVLGKKGFYVSAPLVGLMLFITAVMIAATMASENDARSQTARSTDSQNKLQFISQAILADSYDVLLQENLEKMSSDFLRDEYFDVNTRESWDEGLRTNLVGYYQSKLGQTLGLDIEAYALAYGEMPEIDKCDVDRSETYTSMPSIFESNQVGGINDRTVVVKGYSAGETVHCKANDPEGEIWVDILGRGYRVNIRIPELYDLIVSVITKAKGALNFGDADAEEPIASWAGPGWAIVKKTDNTLLDEGRQDLDGIISKWNETMSWFSDRVVSFANNYFKKEGKVGIKLDSFSVGGWTDMRGLEALDIACVNRGERQPRDCMPIESCRNCMPFRVATVLGDTDCGSCVNCRTLEGKQNPMYRISDLTMKCGNGNCPYDMKEVMTRILEPAGGVCVNYYRTYDAVHPVCKKWEAKAKSVTMTGEIKDDNQLYKISGANNTVFKFMDQHPNVEVGSVKTNRLTCDESGEDANPDDVAEYKANVARLLENMQVKLGFDAGVGDHPVGWVDRGSVIPQGSLILQESGGSPLQSIYDYIYGKGTLPMPCFISGAQARKECTPAGSEEKPKMEMEMDWTETRERCESMANDLCNALCGGTVILDSEWDFCNSLFPAGATVGGRGLLRCNGPRCLTGTDVRIEFMVLSASSSFD